MRKSTNGEKDPPSIQSKNLRTKKGKETLKNFQLGFISSENKFTYSPKEEEKEIKMIEHIVGTSKIFKNHYTCIVYSGHWFVGVQIINFHSI